MASLPVSCEKVKTGMLPLHVPCEKVKTGLLSLHVSREKVTTGMRVVLRLEPLFGRKKGVLTCVSTP